jgi:competence/damage-inducible protein CinA-like protein
MPSAEIITIGTEILLGEIQDTNTAFLARQLMASGIDLFRTHTIGDNPGRIAQSIKDSLQRADIVITTGGLGPTVDDPTREAVALAIDQPLEFHPELWDGICQYFTRIGRVPTENNRRQAYIPKSAQSIHNPVGTAPGFFVKIGSAVILSVPGVPKEMEYLTKNFIIPFLIEEFNIHQVIKSRTIHVSGMGESQLDMIIGEYEKLSNPTVGLLAKPGQIDIRVAAKAETEQSALNMIDIVIHKLGLLLKENIFGYDDDNLIGILTRELSPKKKIGILESGLDGQLSKIFQYSPGLKIESGVYPKNISPNEIRIIMTKRCREWDVPFVISSIFSQENDVSMLDCEILDQGYFTAFNRKFGGSPENGAQWAITMTLDITRRYLISHEFQKD